MMSQRYFCSARLTVAIFAATAAWPAEVSVDAKTGEWTFLGTGFGIASSSLSVEIDGSIRKLDAGRWSGDVLSGTLAGTKLLWQVRFALDRDSALVISSDLRHIGSPKVKLGKVRLVDGPLQLEGDPLVLSMSGWQAPSV